MDPFRQLNPTNDEIRLLQLDLNNLPDKRAHRLISNVDFKSGRRKYAALSYPHGDTKDYTRLIIEGVALQVTTNFTNALDEVIQFWRRSYANRDEEIYLFADQVCVNLSDVEEKSKQVSMMGDIYRHAEEVLIWLPVSADFRGSISTWEDWTHWHRAALRSGALSRGDEMIYNRNSVVSGTAGEYPIMSSQDRNDRDSMLAWTNIQTIVESPWWTRAWILQEFLGPERATFLSQGFAIPGQTLQDLLSQYYSRRKDHAKNLEAKLETLKQRDFQTEAAKDAPGCLEQCCGARRPTTENHDLEASERDTRRRQLSYIQSHLDRHHQAEELWHMVHYILTQREKRLQRGVEHYTHLSDLLKHGSDCKSAEPRDKVYAFLGLATPSYGITPDYSQPLNAVFLATARAIISEERRLDVLAVARENRTPAQGAEALPSWVPDWSDSHRSKLDYKKFLKDVKFPSSTCRASKDTQADVTFHSRFLEVAGIRADKLTKQVENPRYHPYKRFETEFNRDVATVTAAREGDEVWVFLGANEPFTLRKSGSYYIILGHAMISEAGRPSPVLDGALIDQLGSGRGNICQEKIQIT